MEVSNIYGPIITDTEVVLGIGNYNNIHGLLTHNPMNNILQMKSVDDIISIIELVIVYEGNGQLSLAVKGTTDSFIGVCNPNNGTVTACISKEKTYFTLEFSVVDKFLRNKILSGALYSLRVTIDSKEYTVTWKIDGFANGDLIIFLPMTWYERSVGGVCNKWSDTAILLDKLKQSKFRGYTNSTWCEQLPTLTHCTEDHICGKCLGNCEQNNHICYPVANGNFVCKPVDNTLDIVASETNNKTEATPETNNNGPILFITVLLIIMLLLVLSLKYYSPTSKYTLL